MEQLATDFKSIENSIARYIFKKYIMPKPNNQPEPISTNQLSNRDSDSDRDSDMDGDGDIASDMDSDGDYDSGSDVEDVILDETNIGVSNKFDNKLYKLYCQQIFDLERHSFRILQDDVLKEDLKQMSIADKAYEINPKEYNINDNASLPDILRCTYIRKYKHRYYRCKNKVINDDCDVCKKHENCENIYIDKYNELLEQYEQNS
jgi:hypothetical protein